MRYGQTPIEIRPSSKMDQKGLKATSQGWPSGSEKYPEYPPQNTSSGSLIILAPLAFSLEKIASTSSLLRAL